MQYHATINRKSSTKLLNYVISSNLNTVNPEFKVTLLFKSDNLKTVTFILSNGTASQHDRSAVNSTDFTNSDFSLVVWPQNKKPSCR